MNGDDRTEWLAAAQIALSGIPADLLAKGCAHARRVCDHPAKIVPCIIKTVGDEWEERKATAEFYRNWQPPAALLSEPEPTLVLSQEDRAALAEKVAALARSLAVTSSRDPD